MYIMEKTFALSGADLGQMRQVARYEGLRVEIHIDFPLKKVCYTTVLLQRNGFKG